MLMKGTSEILLLSVIGLQLWLPTVYSGCGMARNQEFKSKLIYNNRRQWRSPAPARRPKNATTERPFYPQLEDEDHFTGTTHVDDQCSTKEKRHHDTTTMLRVSFSEDCDYLAFYCLRAYDTGQVCGRTLYFNYETFDNYCMLDYINCMERYELWQIVHMGKCFVVQALQEYEHYSYRDDYFLDQMYVVD